MLLYWFIISTGIAAAFGLYVLSKTKRVYERGKRYREVSLLAGGLQMLPGPP